MYDIVAKIDGAQFDYLEKSFEEYWARKNLVMIDYKLIDKLNVEIATDEIYGKYSLTIDHKLVYLVGNDRYTEKPESGGTEYDELDITVTPSGDISDSVLSKILENEGRDSFKLADIYTRVGWSGEISNDPVGIANYKEFLSLIYAIYNVGYMSEAEQKEVLASGPDSKIFSMSFNLSGSSYGYKYDFYRASDRKVMVHIYECDSDGNPVYGSNKEMCGFYISTFAAKKMISAFMCLMNGEMVDVENTYWD